MLGVFVVIVIIINVELAIIHCLATQPITVAMISMYKMATLTCIGYFDAQWLLWLLGRAMATQASLMRNDCFGYLDAQWPQWLLARAVKRILLTGCYDKAAMIGNQNFVQ